MYEFDTGYRGSFSKETQSYAKRRESHLRWANAHQVPSSSCCCQKAQSSAESSCCEGRVAEVAAFEHVAATGLPPPRPRPGAPTLPASPWPKACSIWPPCSTGTRAATSVGSSPTRSTSAFACKPWTLPCATRRPRTFSILTWQPVYQPRSRTSLAHRRLPYQPRRPGPRHRQRLHRVPLAHGQIGAHLPQPRRRWPALISPARRVLCLLQPPLSCPVFGE